MDQNLIEVKGAGTSRSHNISLDEAATDVHSSVHSQHDADLFSSALKASSHTMSVQVPPTPASQNVPTENPMISSLMKVSDGFKQEQQNISKMISKAVSGDNHEMVMKASIMLSEFQQRVQLLSKVVSKTTSAIDQLTRLQ